MCLNVMWFYGHVVLGLERKRQTTQLQTCYVKPEVLYETAKLLAHVKQGFHLLYTLMNWLTLLLCICIVSELQWSLM